MLSSHTMNTRQRTALAAIGAALASIIAVHNPFGGYDFTYHQYGGWSRFSEEWQSSRLGCTEELHQEMIHLRQQINNSSMSPIEKVAASMSGRPADIYRQCMLVSTTWVPIVTEPRPIWEWQSRSPLHFQLGPLSHVFYALSFVALWGVVILFALRTPKNSND